MLFLGEFLLLDGMVSYLFYRERIAFVIGMLLYPMFYRRKKRIGAHGKRSELNVQFKDCLLSVSGAMRAGYSVENAWKEAERDMAQQYGEESSIYKELRHMNCQVDCNMPLEKLLENAAERSHIEDIENFSGIFSYAKRSGGDFTSIIGSSVQQLCDKMELKEEIETAVAGRKMEQKVMNAVPLFILTFVNGASAGFLEVLYHNAAGVLIMSICLAVYIGAYLWSEQIVDIEV